jgi:sentrin-specific protease 1
LQPHFRPKPPQPFIPKFDQLRISARAKDAEIEQRLRPKPKPLPTSLPPEDEDKVDMILRQRGVVSKHGREQVTDQDLMRLRPVQWLNDEIINFYGSMILARAEASKENPAPNGVAPGKGKPLNAHYFSTFFWSKLKGEGYEKARLAKWTKKVGRCSGFGFHHSLRYPLSSSIYSQRTLCLFRSTIIMPIGPLPSSTFGVNA